MYFCRVEAEVPDDPAYINFRINFTTCPTSRNQRWVFLLNEVDQTCNAMGNWQYADATAAGGESVGTTTTQTVDVYYKNARWREAVVGWQYWGPPTATCPIDAGYRIRRGLAGTPNFYHDFYAERIP